MFLITPVDNNRWAYAMHGLEKPMDHVSAGGVMAGSVATLAILWMSLQTMGLLSHSHSISTYKLPESLQNYLASYTVLSGLPSNYGSEAIVDTGRFQNRRFPKIDGTTLNNSIAFAQMLIDRMSTLENNIANAGVELKTRSPAEKQFWNSYPSADAVDRSIDAIVATKASSYLVHQNCRRFGLDKNDCARYISTLGLRDTPLGKSCAAVHSIECDEKSKYRSIDGTCNNIENPSWGSAMTAYTRVLFSQYFDGIQEPRRVGHSKKPLPSPRLVSTTLSTANNQSDASRTLAVMEWSQFIAHDMAHTPVRKMVSSKKPISCCQPDGDTLSPRHVHPDCAPISIPDHDPVYGDHYVRCMNYVRSLPVLRSECTFGPVEQMNQVSHFLDGSTIYGSTMKKSRELRTFEDGHLRIDVRNNHTYLPRGETELTSQCGENCYNSGDDRVNVHPQLAAIHTVWHREHNRVVDKLARLNPEWSDEILFQEARRIVIAEIQHITYKEWLPILLGRRYTRAIGLIGNSYSHNYNSDDEPAVSNEAATAALRFLNSLMQEKLSMPDNFRQQNKTLQLAEHFFNPRIIESEEVFDGLLRGLATQTSQKMDISLISDMTSKLYASDVNNLGLDAISLDIARGRDHGLPGYNYYRRYCGLPAARTFDDFLDYIPMEMMRKLRTIYSHPSDVDLIVGGMAERPADDGMIGPTFRCLIYEQFSRSRRTDRFFYDSATQPHPFTSEQLVQLRNVTLARIFCDNGNNITHMQLNVFLKPQAGNELRRCTDFEAIPSVDLFAWAERAKAYR
ncbi:PREDICTED: peroxidase-like isoform X1 [Trachymyrmex septentrionalis]|uniref:peroxidase-like isoform X1 n=2 Tax=Trachymyrmex septentrionalis TaxID=34720 RepID=UPI00084ED9AE|nr:PREDICTED: peroxidase-like isoform X1 [Trachymyrmex septentrionalis]